MRALINPFVGLRPFEAEDSLYFFGRNEQTGELLNYLHRSHFLAVVGSSGSGKSSLVRAGLIPNLKAGFLVQDRDTWHIAKMKPGYRPFYNLAEALLAGIGETATDEEIKALADEWESLGFRRVLQRFGPVLEAKQSNLLILVDQFEEIFRYGIYGGSDREREKAVAFVDVLLKLAEQREIPFYVCLTMRSDYIGDCDAFHGLPEAMNRSQYLVPRLTRWQRKQVIEGPVRLAGAEIAPRLVDRLLNESGEFRDDLPVLQHALMRTWNEWQRQDAEAAKPLDTVHYEAIHTMKQALSSHAQEALEELSEEDRKLAELLFQALTETDAENRRIRRPALLNDIAAITGGQPQRLKAIINTFRGQDRSFLVLSAETPEENPLVDIAHESLMRQWDTLAKWMADEAESADIYKRLADAAILKERRKGGLYMDPALQLALEWRESKNPSVAWGERYHKEFVKAMAFLDASKAVREEDKRKKKIKTRMERVVAVIIAIVLVILAGLANVAYQKSEVVKRLTLESNYNLARLFDEKAMNAVELAKRTNNTDKYKEAWLYMTAALRKEIDGNLDHLRPATAGAILTPEVINAAFSVQCVSPPEWAHSDAVNAVVFSPDGKTIASASWDQSIKLWDTTLKKEIYILNGHTSAVTSVAFSPEGNTFASASSDKSIKLWAMNKEKEIATLKGHTSVVTSVAFSPDGNTLASASADQSIRLWDTRLKKEIATLNGHTGTVTSVAFSPDGNTLASASWDQFIKLWDTRLKKEIATLKGTFLNVTSVAFSPDGNTLASTSYGRSIKLWDTKLKKEIATLNGHTNWVTSIVFSPDGRTIATASLDKSIKLWDTKRKKEIATLKGHIDKVTSVAFSPDGNTLASASYDNSIKLWDANQKKEIANLKGHSLRGTSVAVNSDVNISASVSSDNSIKLCDANQKKEIATLKGHIDKVTSVVLSRDGNTLASGSADGSIRLWDLRLLHLFLKGGKPTPLFLTFAEGVDFFWRVRLDVFEYKEVGIRKDYDKKFLPLLAEPKPDQTKFEQILEWAQEQEKKK